MQLDVLPYGVACRLTFPHIFDNPFCMGGGPAEDEGATLPHRNDKAAVPAVPLLPLENHKEVDLDEPVP